MFISKFKILLLVLVSLVIASPTIDSHLIFAPSLKFSYKFGRSSGFGIGGNVGVYHMNHWTISGLNIGMNYNLSQKSLGFNQTLLFGNHLGGVTFGGYLSEKRYLPQIGLYAGYLFGFVDYDYTLFVSASKISLTGYYPIYLAGLNSN